ncbi:MAG: hypothetical protein J4G05_03790 [Chlorobi bacterium]|nr:hypothetical protein [Chlorobiota bacterium]
MASTQAVPRPSLPRINPAVRARLMPFESRSDVPFIAIGKHGVKDYPITQSTIGASPIQGNGSLLWSLFKPSLLLSLRSRTGLPTGRHSVAKVLDTKAWG